MAGTGLTFGLWWSYFILPAGDLLHRHRERNFGWGYGHIPLFAALAAIGAGLHVAALFIEHEAHIGPTATVLTVAIPVAIALFTIYGIYTYVMHETDRLHLGLLAGTIAVLILTVVLAAAGVAMAWCLIVLMCAPLVSVIGYETVGHRHQAAALERQLAA